MEYWIWLTKLKGVGLILQKRLINFFSSPLDVYSATEDQLVLVKGIGKSLAKSIKNSRSLEKSRFILSEIDRKNIKILTYDNPLYPEHAKIYHDSPIVLYYKGTIKSHFKSVAIVGSRRCSEYGKKIAVDAASFLAHKDITVISGMAKGIDSYAHTACINSGGYTIAFLGNGIDICYPKEHIDLMEAIVEKGAIISQFPPGTPPKPQHFPIRNKLISSWSQKILIAEASEKSGSLITANIGYKQKKKVLVPPHEIYSLSGKGNNKLLMKGADLYLSPSQLLLCESKNNVYKEEKQLMTKAESNSLSNLSDTENKIIDSIKYFAKTIDEIDSDLNIGQVKLLELLSIMEIQGVIRSLSGGRYLVY